MLSVSDLYPADAALRFPDALARAGFPPAQWEARCARGGLLAFAAEEGDVAVGFAVAVSYPQGVHVLTLEGAAPACALLLERLVRAAGERDLSVCCPAERADLRGVLQRRGFARRGYSDVADAVAWLYHLDPHDGI
jgi:hypothetical protein